MTDLAFSWQESTVPAGTQDIQCDIEYLDKSYIHVYLDGAETTAFTWTSSTNIRLNLPLSAETAVLLLRKTEREYLYIEFASGAPFIEGNVDTQNTQFLHLAQELVEGRSIEGFYGDINMHRYRITNLGDPVDSRDAANKQYVDARLDQRIDAEHADWVAAITDESSIRKAADDALDVRTTNLEQTHFDANTNSFPWWTVTTVPTTTITPGMPFTKAKVRLNGVTQTAGYSYSVANGVITFAETVPAGTLVDVTIGIDTEVDTGAVSSVLALLSSPAGASYIGTPNGTQANRNVIRYPESFGAVGNGVADDTAALRVACSVPYGLVVLTGKYRITETLVPAEGVHIMGTGSIIHESSKSFTWSASNRASNSPAIMLRKPYVTVEGISITPTYEAIQASSGGDNCRLINITAGGTPTNRCKSSVFVFFSVSNVRVEGCNLGYAGSAATWDTSVSDIRSGGCAGIDFGEVHGISIIATLCHDVGQNGINWYGASDVKILLCTQRYCGQSAIQPGPHPSYTGCVIASNLAEYCCADNIDVRYTGSTSIDVSLTVTNCVSNWIGMLYGDVNYISNDGTGVCTLAMVSNFSVTNCTSLNATGAVLWLQGCVNGTISSINGESEYIRYGLGFFQSSSRINVTGVMIKVKGPALWFGGSATYTDVSINSSTFESTTSYSMVMPNNALTRFSVNDTTLIGYNAINVIFPTNNLTVVAKSTDVSAVYLGAAHLRHTGMTVTATTSAPCVQVGNATGVRILGLHVTNSGSGTTLTIPGAIAFVLKDSLVFNTGTGDAVAITGGQTDSVLAGCNFYSVAGKWMNSTAANHTRLITDNNRENGAVPATWTSITNVFKVSLTQRT